MDALDHDWSESWRKTTPSSRRGATVKFSIFADDSCDGPSGLTAAKKDTTSKMPF
jgi:hypothetical protein